MDIDSLISKIFQRPPIWNKWEKDHANRIVVEKCWEEIGKEMGKEVILLKKKWKYLRDQFTAEFNKHPPSRSGDAAVPHQSKWAYFDSLLFLKEVVRCKQSSGNLSTTIESMPVEIEWVDNPGPSSSSLPLFDMAEMCTVSNIVEEREPATTSEPQAQSSGTPKRRRLQGRSPKKSPRRGSSMADLNRKLYELEREKLEVLKQKFSEKDHDEDDLFLKSLLPLLKKVPEEKKLIVKMELMNVLQKCVYGEK